MNQNTAEAGCYVFEDFCQNIYIYIYINIYIYIYIYINVYVCMMYVCMYLCIYVWYVCMYVCIPYIVRPGLLSTLFLVFDVPRISSFTLFIFLSQKLYHCFNSEGKFARSFVISPCYFSNKISTVISRL